jgi:hypothetical protein
MRYLIFYNPAQVDMIGFFSCALILHKSFPQLLVKKIIACRTGSCGSPTENLLQHDQENLFFLIGIV